MALTTLKERCTDLAWTTQRSAVTPPWRSRSVPGSVVMSLWQLSQRFCPFIQSLVLKIIFFDELIKMISKVLYILNHKSKSKVRCKNIEDYQWIKFQIHGPNIQPCHCVLGLVEKDRVVTVTPNSPESETHVNNQRISQTTTLQNGMTVRFGKLHVFRFIDPNFEEVSKNLISIFID